ncbi:MAG: OmpA family protein [Bacteroidota bacterium]
MLRCWHKLEVVVFIFLLPAIIFSQNIVPNPSFEKYNRRPSAMLDEGVEFTRAVPGWVSPNRASSDFITARFRTTKVERVPPHSGENMVGVVVQGTHWAEYACAPLIEPLEVGKKYYVEFWISAPSAYNKISTGTPLFNDHYGVLFDKRLYFTNTKIIQKKPQIIAPPNTRLTPREWIKINGSFIADQAATHIYIGQFFNPDAPDEIMKNYVFIDDVYVEKIERDAEKFEPSKTYQIKGTVASIVMDNIYFETDKYDILPESYQELDKLVNIMKKNASMTIDIQGHTDSDGSADYNLKLSKNRANAVQQYLVQQGIDASRLTNQGRGLSQPVAENTTSEGKQKNRRVEFVTKSQDTIGQGIILADLAFNFSENIKKYPDQLLKIGKDDRHFDCSNFSQKEPPSSKAFQTALRTFGEYKAKDAQPTILALAEDYEIIHIQTSKRHPEHQLLILHLLAELSAQGFTYIGIEGLEKIEDLKKLGYPTLEMGTPFQQFIYGDVLRRAHTLGFNLFNLQPLEAEAEKALNILKRQKFKFQYQDQEEAAIQWAKAMNVNRILKKNPNAKVLLLSAVVDESKIGHPSTMAFWFKKLMGKEILSIGQSTIFERCANTQNPITAKMNIAKPSIFQKRKNYLRPFLADKNNEGYHTHDLHVYHPKTNFENNRPTYLKLDGSKKAYELNIDKFKMSYPCLVLAYKKGEDVNRAIPLDVIELVDNQDVTPLILPSGSFEIVLRDKEKRKKMEVTLD